MRRTLLVVFAFACALIAPVSAFAASGSYSIDELSSDLIVEANAATRVVEHQVYTFEGACEGCVWYLHVPEDGESVRISSVRVAPVDDGGAPIGDWARLQAIDVNSRLQGDHPGDTALHSMRTRNTQPWYSYSIGDGMIRCWFPTEVDNVVGPLIDHVGASTETDQTDTYLIEVDYTIAHRVRVYGDVAEIYWRYANSSLPVDAHDVNLRIVLPVAADAGAIVPDETVIAWGHGPDGGTFSIGEDGSVTYHVDKVESGNYAEAHVIFPAAWVDNVDRDAANVFGTMRRASAVSEEAAWVDAGMRGENWDNGVRILFLCALLSVLFVGVVALVRNGRTTRSRRALVRVAATLGIIALGEHLFFREPLTTIMLVVAAVVVALVTLWLPMSGEGEMPDDV